MHTPLKITTVCIDPIESSGHSFDVAGQCAFAICIKGEFNIKILNKQYRVTENCMFACMPFIKVEVISVSRTSEIIFGSVLIKDVPRLLNRWVNANNLSAIQNHPLVQIEASQLNKLLYAIKEYQSEYVEIETGVYSNISEHIHEEIIDLQGRLLVAKVLKIYFTNIPMLVSGHTHRDLEYQQFMLALYSNFREHRDVHFYALRSGVSEKYFSTLIRQISGSSPSEWIETVVVGEAKTLLNDAQRSIKEIAAELNFPDAPTFTKYFQRVTGMTPKAYRKGL